MPAVGRACAAPAAYVALHKANVLFLNANSTLLPDNVYTSSKEQIMQNLLALVLLYFLVLPLLGGVLAFFAGAVRARLSDRRKALAGWHPLNPYYALSPYHFGKR